MRTAIVGVVLLSLIPQLAWADPPAPVVAVPPGEDQIVVIKKDEPAPFSGQLYGNATALRWANYLNQYKFRLQADVELQQKLDQAEIDFQKRLVVIEQEKYKTTTGELQAKLSLLQAQVNDPPFYRTVWFGTVLGAFAMAGLVGLTAWGLSSVK